MNNLLLIFLFTFVYVGCVQKDIEVSADDKQLVESTEECESTKADELEKLLEDKKETAFDLSGKESNTGCTLGN